MTLAGETVIISTWCQAQRLNMYRTMLLSGLPEHTRSNPRLRDEWNLGDAELVAAASAASTDKVRFICLTILKSM